MRAYRIYENFQIDLLFWEQFFFLLLPFSGPEFISVGLAAAGTLLRHFFFRCVCVPIGNLSHL